MTPEALAGGHGGLELVVAADLDRGIAREGAIPWRLPGDVRHFKQLTTATADPARQNAVIMGRATWESLPARFRPLPDRRNLVLSRQPRLELPAGVLHGRDLDDALRALAGVTPGIERVFVIGGSQVYAAALARTDCRHVHYTRIDARFGCDTFFPAFEDRFRRAAVLLEAEEAGVAYRIEVWTGPAFLAAEAPARPGA
ncbi:MAG TPA: dihydrofolate reductase [Haliangium sp.]|nr:dihydrofolate reductase [Haliangium sp.]